MLYACDIMPERILTMTYTNLLDVIDGILPKQERGSESKQQKEEERRLFYVAATRAKDRLEQYISIP